MLQKVENIVNLNNITIRRLPIKVLLPLLENASLEEDNDLQERWANLLVNYIDSAQNLHSTVFPYILSQLSSKEAIALDYICDQGFVNYSKLNISGSEASNLVRLGIIRQLPPSARVNKITSTYLDDVYEEDVVEYKEDDINFEITELGIEFVDCCKSK